MSNCADDFYGEISKESDAQDSDASSDYGTDGPTDCRGNCGECCGKSRRANRGSREKRCRESYGEIYVGDVYAAATGIGRWKRLYVLDVLRGWIEDVINQEHIFCIGETVIGLQLL